MGEIKDFKCTYDNSVGISADVTSKLGLTFPYAYEHWETMAAMSVALKEHDGAPLCELPFCHTVEGEAMGGIVNLGNGNTGPRAGGYAFKDMEELLDLPKIDFTKGRIHEVLLACKALKERGEHVVFEISGPFTILNVLIDACNVYKGFRKKPEIMERVFKSMGEQILAYMQEAKAAGAEFISYADSSGGVNILGPKLAARVVDIFTYEFVKKAKDIADDNTMLLLCPKTTFALLGTDRAEFVDHILPAPMRYSQACISMRGKVAIAGQMCIKNVNFVLENRRFKEIRLI